MYRGVEAVSVRMWAVMHVSTNTVLRALGLLREERLLERELAEPPGGRSLVLRDCLPGPKWIAEGHVDSSGPVVSFKLKFLVQ
jgi:hypothetical protein